MEREFMHLIRLLFISRVGLLSHWLSSNDLINLIEHEA